MLESTEILGKFAAAQNLARIKSFMLIPFLIRTSSNSLSFIFTSSQVQLCNFLISLIPTLTAQALNQSSMSSAALRSRNRRLVGILGVFSVISFGFPFLYMRSHNEDTGAAGHAHSSAPLKPNQVMRGNFLNSGTKDIGSSDEYYEKHQQQLIAAQKLKVAPEKLKYKAANSNETNNSN